MRAGNIRNALGIVSELKRKYLTPVSLEYNYSLFDPPEDLDSKAKIYSLLERRFYFHGFVEQGKLAHFHIRIEHGSNNIIPGLREDVLMENRGLRASQHKDNRRKYAVEEIETGATASYKEYGDSGRLLIPLPSDDIGIDSSIHMLEVMLELAGDEHGSAERARSRRRATL